MTEPAGATPTPPQPAAPPAGEAAKTTFTAEDVERMKANWSENIARHETKATKAEKELESLKAKIAKDAEERKLAELTEVERAKKEAEDARREAATLREQHKSSTINAEVKLIGLREGALDAADLLAFIAKDGIEIGEDGTVKGVAEAVAALKEKKPYLFKAAGNETRPAGQNPPGSPSPHKGSAVPYDPALATQERMRRSAIARGMQVPS